MKRRLIRTFGLLALLSLVVGIPLVVGDPTITSIGVYVLLFTGAAVAWNMFSGYTGYISLGHAAYYGVGAYALALLCKAYTIPGGAAPFLLLPLCGVVAVLFAIPVGWIALHTRRYAFTVISIAFFFLFQLLAYNLSGFTGGTRGIYLPVATWETDVFDLPFYYVALSISLLATAMAWWIRRSKFGLDLLAIRDDEERARSLGVPAGRYKLLVYALSAFFFGMVGAEVAYYVGIIYPSFSFDGSLDVSIAVMAFCGGIGTISGPIVGGLLLEPLQQFLDLQFSSVAAGFELMMYGTLLLVVVFLLPEGIVPELRKRWSTWMSVRTRSAVKETLRPLPAGALTATLPQPVDSQTVQEHSVQGIPGTQVPKHIVWSLPPRPGEQAISLPTSLNLSQKMKAHRLEPIPLERSLVPQGQSSNISWRCPVCRKPFKLQGGACYCPRCGITRPLTYYVQKGQCLST
jgi:branched-chain amino acid transport system permease protein